MMTRRPVVVLLLFVFLFTACSSTATIKRRSAPPVEAKIAGSDPQQLFIELPLTDGTAAIPRSDIIDIDHPGNVHLLVGSILTGFGVVLGTLGTILLFSDDSFAFVVGLQLGMNAALYLGVGVPMGIWGYKTWSHSRASAGRPIAKPTKNRVVFLPMLSPTDDGVRVGVGLSRSF